MKYFRKMVEIVALKGVMEEHKSALTETFNTSVKHNEVFIFSPVETEQKDIPDGPARVDAPFKVFSFELSGDRPLTSSDKNTIDRHGYDTKIWCVTVIEIKPQTYKFFMLCEGSNHIGGRWNVLVLDNSDSNNSDITLKNLTAMYLKRLSVERSGIENVREKFRVGSGKNKYFHKIRRVIHISPKSNPATSIGSKGIDWSHKWSVRGHWRSTKGIGKDREDNYSVNGFTWVKSHIKGPEGKPFIKKQRVVDSVLGQ